MIITVSILFWPLEAINPNILYGDGPVRELLSQIKIDVKSFQNQNAEGKLTLLSALQGTGQEGFEPPTPWSVATCSSPLSYKPLRSAQLNYHTL